MRVELDPSTPFRLDATLCCGQAFRWEEHGGWWFGTVGEGAFKVRQKGSVLECENAEEDFVKEYFGLGDDLLKILKCIGKDEYMEAIVNKLRGLRILRQDPWECLMSYICATYKNIPAVKQMILGLARKFGGRTAFEGHDFYTFPTPSRLAKASPARLAECGLGYRAKHVSATAREICSGDFSLEDLDKISYEEARGELLRLPGVGLKVADCVLLFSFGKLEAFPVDIWVKRAVLERYADHLPRGFARKIAKGKSLTNSDYERIRRFGQEYFGEYAGYAQEYLYHYQRTQTGPRHLC
jgi:N-glycosylase/DNA lyase